MRDCHNHVGTGFLHSGHPFFSRSGNIARFHTPLQVLAIPIHDLRGYESNVTHRQLMRPAPLIDNFMLLYSVGSEHRLPGVRIDHVGIDVGKLCALQGFPEKIETVVEFMVPNVAHRIIKPVHCLVDGMSTVFRQILLDGIVTQGAALDQVTVIHEHVVGHLTAGLLNQ